VADKITKDYPFGPRFPLYDEDDVREWQLALERRRGLIALGRRGEKSSLVSAIGIGDVYDHVCPKCQDWALADPEATTKKYLALVNAGKWPRRVWCPEHGVVNRGR
jgi:hypothetical protein